MAVAAILTLDRGNTTLDGMWHGEPCQRRRLDPGDPDALRAFAEDYQPTVIAALSVVDGGLDPLERLASTLGCRFLVAGADMVCPLSLAYEDEAAVGVDRWVGAYAAHRLYGAAVVVDCGTALTVNLVDAGGNFLGGVIAPGPHTMASGLVEAAPALPRADLTARIELPATSPIAAVNAGVKLGFQAMVDGLVAGLTDAAGLDGRLVLTGGGAWIYLDGGRLSCEHHADLIHQGLRWLAEASSTDF